MRFKRFIPAVFWFLMSLVLLCLPGSAIPKSSFLTAIHADQWVHIGMFGMLCGLFAYAFHQDIRSRAQWQRTLLLISLLGIVYGTLMEFVQKYWIPNRSFEIWDIAADSTGCLLAYWFCWRRYGKKIGPDGNRDRNQN